MVMESAGEKGGSFHIHAHGTGATEIFLELFVVLPHSSVGGIYGAGPIVHPFVAEGGGDGTLEHECRQCRNLWGEVVVRGSLASDAGQGEYVVAQGSLFGDAARFAEEKDGARINARQEVHDECGIGGAHSEVDHGDALCSDAAHIGIVAHGR